MILRPYQETVVANGTAILHKYGLLYLACKTRTGKTIMSMSIADRFGAEKVLFVTKCMAMGSVADDFRQSGYTYHFDLISMDSAHKIAGEYDLVIIDEAHAMGAFPRPSDRAQNLRKAVGATPVIFLSATPTPESGSMIFHQLNISSRSPYAGYKNFFAWVKAGYVQVQEKRFGGVTVRDYSKADEARIQRETAQIMITLTQEEAGFSQTMSENVFRVNMIPGINGLIKKLVRERYYKMRDGSEIVCDTPVKLMSKCHQLSGGTVIDENGKAHILDRSKAEAVRDRFAGTKVAIFYKFKAELSLLQEVFPNWTNNPNVFRAERDTVFLGQFVSAREGLELSAADAIVFYSIDHAWLSYAQAKERIQARNRKTQPELWFVFSDTGIEEKIHAAVSAKRNYTSMWFARDFGVKKPAVPVTAAAFGFRRA